MRQFDVLLLDSPELQRVVKIYVKVPKGYDSSTKNYPVLYLHDGQVAFNDYEKDELSWGLLEQYIEAPQQEVILVGIANKDTRIDELLPYVIDRKERGTIGGKTDLYMRFIINTLKPRIDTTYRTKKEPEYTGMMGISFGGLAILYAIAKYNTHFTRFAFISSAFYQVQDRIVQDISDADLHSIKRVYSDVGTMENDKPDVREKYVQSNEEMYQLLEEKLHQGTFQHHIIEGSKHEFEYWNERIPQIIEYLFQ